LRLLRHAQTADYPGQTSGVGRCALLLALRRPDQDRRLTLDIANPLLSIARVRRAATGPGEFVVQWVPWLLVVLNITGVAIMVKYGLPKEVPLIGRTDADPLLGYLGLLLFGLSIAIRVALTVTG
jgi:hypothetical protein